MTGLDRAVRVRVGGSPDTWAGTVAELLGNLGPVSVQTLGRLWSLRPGESLDLGGLTVTVPRGSHLRVIEGGRE